MLRKLLNEKRVLLADGATGTNLFTLGLMAGEAPELLNERAPATITALHQGFVDAGADIILTNSFGGTRHRLKWFGAEDRVFDLNRKAAEIASAVVERAGRVVIVAGSVGPIGELLQPFGTLTYDEAVEAFAEQIRGLKQGGAQIAWIESMSAPGEIHAAAAAAIRVGLPYTYTATFEMAGRTMMGLKPAGIHDVTYGLKEAPLAVGANCGVGAADILGTLLDMSAAAPESLIIVKCNCGVPEYRGGDIQYPDTPELMAEYACLALDGGAHIIGGCCGTGFAHIRAMRAALDMHQRSRRPTLEDIVSRIGPLRNKAASEHTWNIARRERERRRSGSRRA